MSEALVPQLSKPDTLKAFAVELKEFIVKQNLYTNIQGRNYVLCDGWMFAGGSMGLTAVVESCDRLERDTEIAYRATVIVYNGDKVVSRGIAICSNKERSKASFDEYAIASMSQTRAIGKAYRMLLGWLMKAAGYEGTPREEIDENNLEQPERGTDIPSYCVDCGKEMALYVKGAKKGQFHCKGKNALPGQTPSCPPTKPTEADERISKELDDIPVVEVKETTKGLEEPEMSAKEQLKAIPF